MIHPGQRLIQLSTLSCVKHIPIMQMSCPDGASEFQHSHFNNDPTGDSESGNGQGQVIDGSASAPKNSHCKICKKGCPQVKCSINKSEAWTYTCDSCRSTWYTSKCGTNRNSRSDRLKIPFAHIVPPPMSSADPLKASETTDRRDDTILLDSKVLWCKTPRCSGGNNVKYRTDSSDLLSFHEMTCHDCNATWFACPNCIIRWERKCDLDSHMRNDHGLIVPDSVSKSTTSGHKRECEVSKETHLGCKKRALSANELAEQLKQGNEEKRECEVSIETDLGRKKQALSADELSEQLRQVMVEKHLTDATVFGNKSSVDFFLNESKCAGSGVCHLTTKAFRDSSINTHDKEESDYHIMGTALTARLTNSEQRLLSDYINATLQRHQKTNFMACTPMTAHSEMRKHYIDGTNSILKNMPVPKVSGRHENGFVHTSVEEISNHLLARGFPLKTFHWDVESDWRKSDGQYHSLVLKEVREKVGKLGANIPSDLRVHILYMWSDSFQKCPLVQSKKTDIQLFTGYFVPADGERDITKYTQPLAIGIKNKEHQDTLVSILQETMKVERIERRYCGIEKKMVDVVIVRIMIQNDHPERINNTQTMQKGTYHKRWGYSCEFFTEIPSCRDCFLKRLNEVVDHQHEYTNGNSDKACSNCADWWNEFDSNEQGWFEKPKDYPVNKSSESPDYPDGRDVDANSKLLPPCKLSFPFLKKAFDFAIHNCLVKKRRWSDKNLNAYLRTCCFHGGLIDSIMEAIKEVRGKALKQDDIIPPGLWNKFEELTLDLAQFVDTPMHMLFLGVQKHMMKHIERIFCKNKELYRKFSLMIQTLLSICAKQSITWCRVLPFSKDDSFGTAAWQSDHYSGFARLSLIYFGYLDDWKDDIDPDAFLSLKQMLVFWYSLLSTLFGDGECNADTVDHYVKLFLSASCMYGEKTTIDVLGGKKSTKKRKGNGNDICYFEKTSNYFSLLNLKDLVLRFGHMRKLWEGEREKYIKFVKKVLQSMQNSDTYLTNTLQKLLQTHCLDQFMEDNMHHSPASYSRTLNYKVYKSWDVFKEEFWDSGIMLSGVLVEGTDGIYICIQEGDIIKLVNFHFNDSIGQMKWNLYYAPLVHTWDNCSILEVNDREKLNKIVTDTLIIHPMVTDEGKFDKQNGHTVISSSWRVRTKDGFMKRMCPEEDIFYTVLQV